MYNHIGPSGNGLSRFGPYLTERHRTPWGDAVNFDGPDSAEVRRFVIDNLRHWVNNFHVDGFRLDATHAIIDNSPQPILGELASEMSAMSSDRQWPIWLLAEHEAIDERLLFPTEQGGAGLDAVWDDHVHHALHALLTGERGGYYQAWGSMEDLARVLVGRGSTDVGPRSGQFVVFSQNHDQVGNRALGERLCHLGGPPVAMMAAALVLLAPGLPLIFMGEEWAASTPFPYFCAERSAELDLALRQGRVQEFASFGWDELPEPIDPATAESARLRWEERSAPMHAEMLAWYTELIRLRRTRPELGSQQPASVTFDPEARWLRLDRGTTAVMFNMADTAQGVPFKMALTMGSPTVQVLATSLPPVEVEGPTLRMAPWSVAVVSSG